MDPSTVETVGSWIVVSKDVLLGVSACIVAYCAIAGLRSWRKELKGRSEFQVAKDLLISAYKVRDAFKHVRYPIIFTYEYPDDLLKSEKFNSPEDNYKCHLHAYNKRWEAMEEAFQSLEEQHLYAQVIFGPQYQDRILKLRKCRSELLNAIQLWLEGIKNPDRQEISDAEQRADMRSVLYHIPGYEKDKFTPDIDEAVREFEEWLFQHIHK